MVRCVPYYNFMALLLEHFGCFKENSFNWRMRLHDTIVKDDPNYHRPGLNFLERILVPRKWQTFWVEIPRPIVYDQTGYVADGFKIASHGPNRGRDMLLAFGGYWDAVVRKSVALVES
jgi:hypothetical protein